MKSLPSAVLVIGPTPPPYHGVAVAMQSLLSEEHDARLTLVHLDIADRRGIEHVDQPDLHDVAAFCAQWLRLLWLLVTRRPRVVYLAISQSTIGFLRDGMFILLAALFRRRIVIHLHGGNFAHWYGGRSTPMRAFVRLILGLCTRFIVLAEAFRASITPLVAARKVVVVPNGVRWGTAMPPAAAAPRGRCILFLSTLSRAKGALLLLEAFAAARPRVPDLELVLAGPWLNEGDRDSALAVIARHRMQGCVRLAGSVEGRAKVALYEAADLFVFPGIQQEGQPLVVLEAMAAGLPVLYSERGCLAETVGSECGVAFRLGDAGDLAQKLAALLEHPEELHRLGAAARRRYETHYSERQFIARMTQVLLESAGVAA